MYTAISECDSDFAMRWLSGKFCLSHEESSSDQELDQLAVVIMFLIVMVVVPQVYTLSL